MKRKKLLLLALAFPILLLIPLALMSASSATGEQDDAPVGVNKEKHPVIIREPEGSLLIDSGEVGRDGEPLMVSCAYCHEERKPEQPIRSADELDEFHVGLTFQHGSLSCTSCHAAQDNESLRLADGTLLERGDVMSLCKQCHGPQARDYANGSHGGMNGYWDLTRGGRVRNNCVNCHDPHAPAFQMMEPVLPVRDRFLSKRQHDEEETENDEH